MKKTLIFFLEEGLRMTLDGVDSVRIYSFFQSRFGQTTDPRKHMMTALYLQGIL